MLRQTTETFDEACERLTATVRYQAKNYAYFVCLKDTDEAIGFCGIIEPEPRVFSETGICIGAEWQGRGYGKEVLNALLDIAFYKLGGESFICSCFHENERSANLCKKLGFRYLHTERMTREWDGFEYDCDNYILKKEDRI